MYKALRKTGGLIIIAVFVGMACETVGETYPSSVVGWNLPINMFILLFSVWLTGYFAGDRS